MRSTTFLKAALLAASVGIVAPAGAQQQGDGAPDKAGAPTMGSPGAAAAVQGGQQGDCPEGQVQSAGGACAPAQPGTAGGTGSGTQMPASPHQQETLQKQ